MDNDTISYFDNYTPEYSVGRLAHVVTAIKCYGPKNGSLLDIGCGTGNTLEFVRNKTSLKNFYGMDVSQKCLLKTKERIDCDTFLGSILDSNFIDKISERFNFVLLSAVLHHLIGKTRKESKAYSFLAIQNCLRLLKDDGYLIIMEPTFCPSIAMDIIFYIKKLLTKITSKRVSMFGKYNNLGAPVVSYFTDKQLLKMVNDIKSCRIVEKNIEERKVSFLWRFALIKHRRDATIVVKKY